MTTQTPDAVREPTYVATDGILDNPAGFPIACRMSLQQHESRNASMERLASALNAASALIDKIEDTPSLFFGMEDTCEDEFATLRDALQALAQVQS